LAGQQKVGDLERDCGAETQQHTNRLRPHRVANFRADVDAQAQWLMRSRRR
jgi:hypothetical protein